MNIIIFLIILVLLVLVHEFGHFIVAKKNGVRVMEFGLGFPPRILGKKIGETLYSVNSLPFGGFVRIFGENPEDDALHPDDLARSLSHKNKWIQAAVLSAGVIFNVIFAWLILSLGLAIGLPTVGQSAESSSRYSLSDTHLVITSVMPKSPAEKGGLKPGDLLLSLQTGSVVLDKDLTPDSVRAFIAPSDNPIVISYKRGSKNFKTTIKPESGIITDAKAIGIAMDTIGLLRLPIHKAFVEGASMTARLTKSVSVSIFHFFSDIVSGHADFSQVAGPVGMVSLVGDAREMGFGYLIFFAALISINLAVINLLPLPALDGGRLFILLIETIKGSPLRPRLVTAVNTAGFGLLILLMIAVTYKDISRLFGH